MALPFFQTKQETSLGVDIGTSSIKIVELVKKGRDIELSNYAEYSTGEGSAIHSSSTRLLSSQVSDFIKQLIRKAKIESGEATMSIPMFSGFSTVINMPAMSDAELSQAVQYEAKKYIPLPLSEVQFEWMKLGQGSGNLQDARDKKQTRLLIVAVTNELINKYHEIAKLSGLTLEYLELESFSLARSLVPIRSAESNQSGVLPKSLAKGSAKQPQSAVLVIDVGSRSSTITLVEGGWPIFSRSMDVSGLELSKVLSSSLGIDFPRAEQLKKQEGLEVGDGILLPLIDNVLGEARRIMENYTKVRKLPITNIVLSGGTSNMPGFLDHVVKTLGRQTRKAEPFRDIIYPEGIDTVIKEMNPSFSIAVGLALREFI